MKTAKERAEMTAKERSDALRRNRITANVTVDWNHPNSKFMPNDLVQVVPKINECESHKLASKQGCYGIVVARSRTPDGTARGSANTDWFQPRRQFTRYYVEFEDGYVGGYHSHYLVPVA